MRTGRRLGEERVPFSATLLFKTSISNSIPEVST